MMRSFEKTTKALALVAFTALAATTGCVAQADDAVAEDEVLAPETAGEAIAAWTEGADQDGNCCCWNEVPSQQAPLPPEVAQPPMQQPPMQQPPMQQPPMQQPPMQQPPVQQPGFATPCAPGVGVAGCAPAVGCAPIAGCATPCAGPCFGPIPGGFHTIVRPITGQFIAVPGLRNCWLAGLAGCGC